MSLVTESSCAKPWRVWRQVGQQHYFSILGCTWINQFLVVLPLGLATHSARCRKRFLSRPLTSPIRCETKHSWIGNYGSVLEQQDNSLIKSLLDQREIGNHGEHWPAFSDIDWPCLTFTGILDCIQQYFPPIEARHEAIFRFLRTLQHSGRSSWLRDFHC